MQIYTTIFEIFHISTDTKIFKVDKVINILYAIIQVVYRIHIHTYAMYIRVFILYMCIYTYTYHIHVYLCYIYIIHMYVYVYTHHHMNITYVYLYTYHVYHTYTTQQYIIRNQVVSTFLQFIYEARNGLRGKVHLLFSRVNAFLHRGQKQR